MDPVAASRAFERALLGGRAGLAEPQPGALVGLEHEFVVRDGAGVLDFRKLIRELPIDGRRLDPGDVNAHRCRWGGVITADEAEAEVAIAPVARRPGFVGRLEAEADRGREALRASLPDAVRLDGYSTHLNVAMSGALNVAACELFASTFAPGLMLLADRADSPGALIRPRPGRLEVGVEHVAGRQLRAAAAYVTGGALAVAAVVSGATGAAVPTALDVRWVKTADRPGYGLRRDAFGPDLLAQGRGALLTTKAGRTVTAQQQLEQSWFLARAALEPLARPGDLEAADRIVAGHEPLPSEEHAPERRARRPPARGADDATFGAILTPRQRPGFVVAAEIATWDLTVFTIAGSGRTAYAAVPRATLGRFLRLLDHGRLDGTIRAYLAAEPAGRVLHGWAASQRPGLHDALAAAASFVAPEMRYAVVAAPAEPGTGSLDRLGKGTGRVDAPERPVTERPGRPVTERPRRRIPWWPWVPVLLVALGGGGLLLTALPGQPAPTPSPLPSEPVTASGSPSTIGPTPSTVLATLRATPSVPAVATPSPVPTLSEVPAVVTPPPTATPTSTPTPTPTPVPTPSPPPSAPAIPAAPTTFTGTGTFAGELVATGGNLAHEEFGRLAGPRSVVATEGSIRFTSGTRWIAVTGDLAADGTFVARGTGTYAGFAGIRVEFRGSVTPRDLEGDYTVGVGGALPGGQPIVYHFAGRRTDAPRPALPNGLDAFISAFVDAQRTHDEAFLAAQLHPAVIELYGADQCAGSIAALEPDVGYGILVTAAAGPGVWDYNPDGRLIPVPDVYTLSATISSSFAAPANRVIHFGWAAGEFRWFTDCGTPLPAP